MARNKAYLTCDRTAKGDECYTPYYAVSPLLKYLEKFKQKLGKDNITIWTPCDEEWSAYVQLFTENGFSVIRSSIVDGQNFLTYEPEENYDVIITNLPFSKKDAMLERLDKLGKPFAVLLPANSIQGSKRYEKCFRNGIQMLCFDKRIGFHTNDNFEKTAEGNHFGSAYFCRDFLERDLIVEELVKYDRPLTIQND